MLKNLSLTTLILFGVIFAQWTPRGGGGQNSDVAPPIPGGYGGYGGNGQHAYLRAVFAACFSPIFRYNFC